MKESLDHLEEPVVRHVRTDVPLLRREFTVQEALDLIRREGVGERIIYFYVVDEGKKLVGVLPTRRLLTSPLERPVSEIMVPRVLAIPDTATVMDACELFVLHKFLAFPVVDPERHMVGVVEVGLLTEEMALQTGDTDEPRRMDDLFETIGLRLAAVRDASPFTAFRFRFPWLLATMASGMVAALLVGLHESTLAASLVLAFFLTLVLGLGESVSAQSMTVTVQALRTRRPSGDWYLGALKRELGVAVLLGLGCGLLVALVVLVWRGDPAAALVIGGSIVLSLAVACVLGLSVPTLLHAFHLDPKIAAGPVTLALADVFTILFYFNLGHLVLGGR